jgi:hypothetical protein
VRLQQRIALIFHQQVERHDIAVPRGHMHWRLPVLGDDVRIGSRLQQHQHAPIAVGHAGAEMQRRLLQLSTLDMQIGAEAKQRFDDSGLGRLHSYVQRGVIVL